MQKYLFGILLFVGSHANPASAFPLVLPTLTINAVNSPGPGATMITLGSAYSATDTFNFVASGTPNLTSAGAYITNAAGILTQPDTLFGGTVGQYKNLNTFVQNTGTPALGALVVALSTNGGASFSSAFTLFDPTLPAYGFGSSAPPTTLTYTGTVGSIFGTSLAAGDVLEFYSDDAIGSFADNSGSFTLVGFSAPEIDPGTSAIPLGLGLGILAMVSDKRRKAA